jgi:hypothetical protein
MRERVLLNTFRGLVWVGVKVLSVESVHLSFVLSALVGPKHDHHLTI